MKEGLEEACQKVDMEFLNALDGIFLVRMKNITQKKKNSVRTTRVMTRIIAGHLQNRSQKRE